MKTFAEILKTLPDVSHIERMEITRADGGAQVGTLENRPGQAGSLAVYHAVANARGIIGKAEAERALQLYAEHTEDARLHPGKHPNIDRLLDLIAVNGSVALTIIDKQG